jgi:BlaI family transcriptional regulator, penicillinase repressor
MTHRPGLSDAERDVLRVLWDCGPATVRQTNEMLVKRGRKWAYTTVATLLQRLTIKQYVTSDPSTISHVYRAVVSRDELLERRLRDAADELCDGHTAPLVLALVQGSRFSTEELARLRRLLDEAVGRTSSPPKSKA